MSRCRSCGQRIVWVWTEAGKRMPVDPDPVQDGNVRSLRGDGQLFESALVEVVPRDSGDTLFGAVTEPRYVSHFATCPQAADHRRR